MLGVSSFWTGYHNTILENKTSSSFSSKETWEVSSFKLIGSCRSQLGCVTTPINNPYPAPSSKEEKFNTLIGVLNTGLQILIQCRVDK